MMMSLDVQRENHGEIHPCESPDEMESLVLDDAPNGRLSTVLEHPLSRPSVDDDMLAPSPSFSNTNSPVNTFIDPPSYADAVFISFDESSSVVERNGSESPNASSSSDLKPYYLSISVGEPQKELESSTSIVPGGNTYFSYLITTSTNMPEFKARQFSVRRRFKDVVTLADRLSETYRGFFIPPRPDKNVVESRMMQEQEFVDQRRVSLERYLRKLALHPEIRKSDELRVFLQALGKLPLPQNTDVASRMLDGAVKLPKQLFGDGSAIVDLHEVIQPAKVGRDLLRIFKELKQSVSNDWSGAKPTIVEDDRAFLEKKNMLQVIESQLSNVSQQAESLVKAQQDIGETSGELGLAFVKLTKFETDEAVYNSQRVRAADMKNVATAAVKASRLWRELNSQTVKHLDKLHDHLGMMLAVNTAFSDRASALLTVQTLGTELASLHSRIDKLEAASSKIFGGDRSRIQKIEALKETIKVTEDTKSCAIKEYERIKENNRKELERLDQERWTDFVTMLKGFVFNQVGYAEKMVNVWKKVADETRNYADDTGTPGQK